MEASHVNPQVKKEHPLQMEVFMNSQAYEVQLLQMELPQVATFSNIMDLLKVMSLIMHIYYELKSLDYEAITIEFVNYLPRNQR